MQGVPSHAEVPYAPPSLRTPIVAALVAFLVGGALATGAWWLTDNDVSVVPEPATKVIVADTPVQPSGGVAAKNEAAVAAAVGGPVLAPGEQYGTSQYRFAAGTAAKDEAGVATAVGSGTGVAAVGSGTHQHGE